MARGKPHKKAVGPKKTEAKEALEALRTDLRRGEYRFLKDGKTKFNDYAKRYLKYSKAVKNSWKRGRSSIKALTAFFKGTFLSKITAGQIEKYKTKRIEEVSQASVNRELSCLSAIFQEAKREKLVRENPARGARFHPCS